MLTKGQIPPQLAPFIGVVLFIIILSAVLPALMKSIRTVTECGKVREELSTCKGNLESCYGDIEDYRRQVGSLNTQLSQCRDKLNELNVSVSECQRDLSECQLNLSSSLEKISELSECCDNLDTCNIELQKCKESMGNITHLNIENYNIVFGSIVINMATFMKILYIIIPVSLVLELISIKIEFDEDVEKIISFIKIFVNLIILSLIVSFFTELSPHLLIALSFLFSLFWVIRKYEE